MIQQYKVRHETIKRRVHWEIFKKYVMKYSKKWYQNMPEKLSTSANSNTKILWDVEIDGKVKHNRPNITIKEKDAREWCFLHVTVS